MTIEEQVVQAISNGETESFLKEIDLTDSVPGISTYTVLLEIILQFIERSGYHEKAGALLIEKGIRGRLLADPAQEKERPHIFIETLKRATPLYGIFTSDLLRRIILLVLRDPQTLDSKEFTDFLPLERYQALNSHYFHYFVDRMDLNINGMSLFYNCVDSLKNSKVWLMETVAKRMKKKLNERQSLIFYLRNFIRPYWISSGQHVDEDFWYVPDPFWLQIFDSSNDFLLFIRNQQPDGELLELEIEIRHIVFLIDPSKPYFDSRYYRLNPLLHNNLRKEDMLRGR